MYLEFYGAADEVTGSMHRLHVNGHDVLLECGLFQGRRAEANRLNREVPPWATQAHCLILSHAHLDHTGNSPSLVKRGFRGNIYCTPATRDLCSVMLRDAAMIQVQDAAYLNRHAQRDGRNEHIEPLYTPEDAAKAVAQMISVPLHRPMPVAPGVTMTFHDSAHVLGSALVQLDLQEQGRSLRLLFTGDLGRQALPLLGDPEIVPGVELLLMESTYGDRFHPEVSELDERLAKIVRDTVERGGRVYIPTFALERAQEVLFALDRLHAAGKVPQVPIYIDSPLAIAITEIYKLHPEGLDEHIRERILARDDPFSPPGLRYVSDVGSSMRLQESREPCIVIAGSGMCEGGRILHHFRKGLEDQRNSVVVVGFMAQHTLGRRLVEGRRRVKVYGLERDVYAQIHVLEGLSAHADQKDLVTFAEATREVGKLRRIALVHGEDGARRALKEALTERGFPEVILSQRGLRIDL